MHEGDELSLAFFSSALLQDQPVEHPSVHALHLLLAEEVKSIAIAYLKLVNLLQQLLVRKQGFREFGIWRNYFRVFLINAEENDSVHSLRGLTRCIGKKW